MKSGACHRSVSTPVARERGVGALAHDYSNMMHSIDLLNSRWTSQRSEIAQCFQSLPGAI